jgi:hypothetical protein
LEEKMANAAQQAAQTLTAQYYNTITTALQLSPNSFQLVQGSVAVPTTSDALWNVMDAVPAASINNFFSGSGMNLLSQDYGAVVNHLKPQNTGQFQQCMSDYYNTWQTYIGQNVDKVLNSDGEIDQTKLTNVFRSWATLAYPNGITCSTFLLEQYNDPVTVAILKYNDAVNAKKGFAYTTTVADMQYSLQTAPSASFSFDSSTASSDVSHTWANGAVSGAFDFFSGSASASYDKLTQQLTAQNVNVKGSFAKFATINAQPLANPNTTDPILSTMEPWMDSAALSIAYSNNNNTVWNPGQPSWDSTFGKDGNLQRYTAGVVIVDGIDITITSSASFSSSDQQTINTAAKAGFWPFFSVSGGGGSSTTTTFNDKGQMTSTISSPQGNPRVLGVLVNPITALFAANLASANIAKKAPQPAAASKKKVA